MKILVLAALIVLISCSAPPAPADMPAGVPMPPPVGAGDYCKRHPAGENCT